MSKAAPPPAVQAVETADRVLLNQQDSIRKSSAVAYLTFFLSVLAAVLLATVLGLMYADHLLLREVMTRQEHDRAAEREACQRQTDLLRESVDRMTEELRTVRRLLERQAGDEW